MEVNLIFDQEAAAREGSHALDQTRTMDRDQNRSERKPAIAAIGPSTEAQVSDRNSRSFDPAPAGKAIGVGRPMIFAVVPFLGLSSDQK
ncbi:MAG TPA: hypothetical protein VEH77_06615 [Roseiarcus sp.]|nr:hypothetical protein [Roseiarcus sp.]